MQSCGDLPCLHDEEIGAGEDVLARLVFRAPYEASRLVPGEGKNLASELPYGDVRSAIGFYLKRTTAIA
jgi:hypothetical protein